LNYNGPEITIFSAENLRPKVVIPLTNYFPNFIQRGVLLTLSKETNKLYVAGQNNTLYSALCFDTTTNKLAKPQFNFSFIPHGYNITLFNEANGKFFLIARPKAANYSTSWVSFYGNQKTVFARLTASNDPNFVFEKNNETVTIDNIGYVHGYVIDGDFIYFTTATGQILKFRQSDFKYLGKMILVSQSRNVSQYEAGVMPNLGNPIIQGRSLWVWAIWWSKFIKVNLDAFCYDTDPCATPESEPNLNVMGLPVVVLIVVIIGSALCYCGCIALFVSLAFIRTKHSKHHGETKKLIN